MLTIGQINKKYELESLLNNCVDDDEAILLERELKALERREIISELFVDKNEEAKQDYPEGEE